jgi:diguanylate cyclase (GGDEF)-like protein
VTLPRHLDLAALALGLAATLVGAAGVAAYMTNEAAWLRAIPDTPAIAFSEAIALMIGGFAVAAAALAPLPRIRRLAVLAGGALTCLGVECLVAGSLGTQLAIDLPALDVAPGRGAPAERMVASAGVCLALLGATIACLPLLRGRRSAIALTAAATIAGAFGATTLAGYLLHVEFLVSWPSDSALAPNTALGLALLGAGACSAVLHHAKFSGGIAGESRAIQLTAVWMLSLFAVIAGVSTFALAQLEYQSAVRAELARSLDDRRAFLAYAIGEHLQQVGFGAHSVAAATHAAPREPAAREAMRRKLAASADALTAAGFSAWRFDVDGMRVSAGRFVDAPQFEVALAPPADTHLLLKDGEYYLRTRIVLRDGERVVGSALAEDPFPELGRLKAEADRWGTTGTLVLCASQDDALACFPSRNSSAGTRARRDATGRAVPASLAIDRQAGVDEMLDLRQHRTLAAYGPVGATGLGMVMKIDIAEMNAPLGRRFGGAVLLLAILVALGVWMLRRRIRPLTDALVDAREEATRVASQFKGVAEVSMDGCFLMDAVRNRRGQIVDFRIRFVNARGAVLVGRASDDVTGRTLHELLPPDQATYFVSRYARIVASGASLAEQFRMSSTDRSAPWIAHQAVKLGDGVSVTARDITDLKNVERQLRSKAENDALTGLPNRALFFERLGRALTEARSARKGVAVLFLDVDRFKTINDTHGHAAGDDVLIEFGRRLRALVRVTDTVARLGGDEFAILLPALEAVEQAERIAAGILTAMARPFRIAGGEIEVGTSIGVGFSAGLDTPEALVGRADRKLYQAKTGGRGRFASGSERRAA